jgi:hypothetical protein
MKKKKKRSDVKTICNIASYETIYIYFLFRLYTIWTAKNLLILVMENELEDSVYKCYS